MQNFIIFTLFWIVFISHSYAYSFKNLGLQNGLSQPSVLSICQDEIGRMWFATAEGLNIYDGKDIKIYKGNVTTASGQEVWIGNYISKVKSDKNGNIIHFSNGCLYLSNIEKNVYKQLTFNFQTAHFTITNDAVWYIEKDTLKTYRPQEDKHSFVSLLPKANYTFIEIGEHNIYVGSSNGLYILTKDYKIKAEELKGKCISYILENSFGEVWIGTAEDGLYVYANKGLRKIPLTPNSNEGIKDNMIRDIIEDSGGNIWFGTFAGLEKYNRKKNRFELYNKPQYLGGLKHQSVYSLYIDKQDNLWIGTFFGGVSYFNLKNKGIQHYDYQSIHNSNAQFLYIGEMLLDKRNNLWISTDGEGVSGLTPEWSMFKRLNTASKESLPSDKIKSLAYDPMTDKLYIGMHLGGFSVYDINKDQISHHQLPKVTEKDKHTNIVYHIEIWRNKVYLSTPSFLYEYNPQSNQLREITKINDYCIDFKITNNGTFIARRPHLLEIFSLSTPNNKKYVNLLKHGFQGEISSLLLEEDGVYLMTLGNGILHYNLNTGEITSYTEEQHNIPTNYCYQSKRISDEQMVVTCDKGAFMFNPKEKSFGLFKDSERQISVMRECGLTASEDGHIYIGDTKGISKLSGEDFQFKENKNYSIFFTNLYINNQPIMPTKNQKILSSTLLYTSEIHLRHEQNNLLVNFAHSDFLNVQKEEIFAYKLQGYDDMWNYTKQNSIHYSHLTPGSYTLYVKMANRKDSPVASLKIHVASPLYATWWAYLLYICSIGTILIIVLRYKIRQQHLAFSLKNERFEKQKMEQLNQEKLVFFTNVSHEFRTPLTLIISHIDLLLSEQGIPTPIYNMVYKLKKNAQYMNNLVSELLDFRKFTQNHFVLKIGEQDFSSFMQELYLTFTDLAQRKGISLVIENEQTGHITGWFDAKQLEKVFFNLLSNAFKYTPSNGQISIKVNTAENKAIVCITDTGKGISKEDSRKLFERFYQGKDQGDNVQSPGTGIGLALTRTIVEKHHGEISVESEEGKGSTFIVSIPLNKAAYEEDELIEFIDSSESKSYVIDNENVTGNHDKSFAITSELNLEDDNVSEEDNASEDESIDKIYNHETESSSEFKHKRKILLVEDNQELILILKRLFENNFEVITAENGKEGLDKTFEHKPDLIISDIMMPVMSGTELCVQIKNNIDLCHIPIILLTALNGFEQNIEGLNRGADDYISKPFNTQLLLARVNNLIRNRLLIQNQINQNSVGEIDLTSINPIDQQILKKTEEILKKNLDNTHFGISDLCKELGMGRSLLFTKFKALTGMTPNNYIINFKLKHAAILLRKPSISIAEISDLCGFGSSTYFSRCFKSQFGVSPQVYRKNL